MKWAIIAHFYLDSLKVPTLYSSLSMKNWNLVSILILACLGIVPSAFSIENQPGATSAAVQDLVYQAMDRKLFDERIWGKLLHYENTLLFNKVSQVTDPNFFLSADGHYKKDQELRATLLAFFASVDLKDKHAVCRFPARLNWLKQKLKDHPAWKQLPEPVCYYQDIYLRNLDAESVSYVFSSYYANNPGSAFGHTFFRVNKKVKAGRAKQELLDYGISYAAQVTSGNPVLYMLNGLLGGFKGTYVSVPYYYKVREYNDYESRDLWSYELNLDEAEVKQLIYHLWELGPHYFDYYFFTQNCSFHMLTVLEAASERIELVDKVPLYVIPSDSVKALFQVPGFVRKIEFRPSLRKHFESKWVQLNPEEKNNFLLVIDHFSKEKMNSFRFATPERKALFYDTLMDYADMEDPKGIANREGHWHTVKEFLLVSRAEIPVISEDAVIPMPREGRPDDSHPSGRMSIGIGGDKNKTNGFFQYRFAFHDLLDNSTGLPMYSQLEFISFKFQLIDRDFNLDNFSFFNILQLNPLSRINPKMSWGMELGARNMSLCAGSRSCLGTGFQGYAGYAAVIKGNLFWLLPFFHYRYSEQFVTTPNYLSLGYQLGYLYEFSEKYKLMAKYIKEIPNRFEAIDSASISARYNFQYKHSVEIGWSANQLTKSNDSQTTKFLYHYFF